MSDYYDYGYKVPPTCPTCGARNPAWDPMAAACPQAVSWF